MKLRSVAASLAIPFVFAAQPYDADAQTKKAKPPAGSKLYRVKPLPPPSFEQACPQIGKLETVTMPSDYDLVVRDSIKFKIGDDIKSENAQMLDLIEKFQSTGPKEKEGYHITFSTGGGDYYAGMAIVDAIKHYGAYNFTAHVPTIAASAGSIILSAVKGKKYMMPNAEIMTHATNFEVDAEQFKTGNKALIKEIEKRGAVYNASVKNHYREALGLSGACADYLMNNEDLYISARQALALKFVDAIFRPDNQIEVRKEDADFFIRPPEGPVKNNQSSTSAVIARAELDR